MLVHLCPAAGSAWGCLGLWEERHLVQGLLRPPEVQHWRGEEAASDPMNGVLFGCLSCAQEPMDPCFFFLDSRDLGATARDSRVFFQLLAGCSGKDCVQ